MNRFRRTFAGALCAAAILSAGATFAETPVLSAKDQKQADSEAKDGATISAEVAKQMKLSTDQAQIDRVNKIGQKIAEFANTTRVSIDPKKGFGNDKVYPFTWHFNVIDSKEVNAFSLPGGYVYVNSGLLSFVRSDDELAAVLGHEITHAAHHHSVELAHQQSKFSTGTMVAMIAAALAHVDMSDVAHVAAGVTYTQMGIMNNHYGQNAESDADHGGIVLMQKAGYNPVGALTFMQRLAEQETHGVDINYGILQDHPFTKERVASIGTQLAQMNVNVTPKVLATVTNAKRFAVQEGAMPGAKNIVLGDVLCATLDDPDGSRSQSIVKALNAQFDSGLELRHISQTDNRVLVKDQPLLTMTAADAALAHEPTPAAVASDVAKNIKTALYRSSFSLYNPDAKPQVTSGAPEAQHFLSVNGVTGFK
ncbi:MAG: M48 family metalloprotease [Capsulimonas sp.]|uniref:M48 family metalloprotease n=1 Tax=Capsulimonas sp. TaxID=2494211 RepID=UPI0032644ADE